MSQEKEHAINDEVRIAKERKILNNAEYSPDVKTITTTKRSTLPSNVSNADQRTSLKVDNEGALEKGTTTQSIVKNNTVTDVNTATVPRTVQSGVKSNVTDKSTGIPTRIQRIQPPLLLRKQIELSKIRLQERNRRKRSSD